MLGEGAYENGPEYPQGPITPLVVRRQAWWALMAGGFHTYGQDQMWRMEPGWDKTFDTPGAAQVCLMKAHRHLAPVVGPHPRPGRLRERRRQRAHPERGDALDGRQPASSSTSRAPRPSSSTSTRSRRRRRGPPGSARSPASARTRAPSPPATAPAAPSPPPPRSSSRPRTSGRTRSCCWKASRPRARLAPPRLPHSPGPSLACLARRSIGLLWSPCTGHRERGGPEDARIARYHDRRLRCRAPRGVRHAPW